MAGEARPFTGLAILFFVAHAARQSPSIGFQSMRTCVGSNSGRLVRPSFAVTLYALVAVSSSGCAARPGTTGSESCALQLVAERTGLEVDRLLAGNEILCDRPGERCFLVYEDGRFNSWEVAVQGPSCVGKVVLVPE